MSSGNERFNDEAAAWDTNPSVIQASEGALKAILRFRPDLEEARARGTAAKSGIDVLEIGCGTGLLTLPMAPYVRSIVAVDAASGMIDALKLKLARQDPAVQAAVTPVCALLAGPEDAALPPATPETTSSTTDGISSAVPRRKFDLITSHLVLHHIPDLAELVHMLYGCLKSGGQLALTDYEDFGPQARRFHPEAKMAGVERHGIDAEWFAQLMCNAGFVNVLVKADWTMTKEVERFPGEWTKGKPAGVTLDTLAFPFLLCRGTKP